MTKNPYSTVLNPFRTPQFEPIPGREADMVKNRAGGHVFTLSPWSQLTRFLILGAEGPTYYASEREMILDNARALQHCIAEDGVRVVSHIAEIDFANRAPKRGPILFALGVALARGSDATKAAVVDAIPSIVRTASDLFQLLSILADLKGRPVAGRSVRRMVEGWYNGKTPSALAYQMVKYRARSGFTHQDAIRLGHPSPSTPEHAALFRWAVRNDDPMTPLPDESFAKIIHGFTHAQAADAPSTAARIISDYGLTWEMIKPEHLKSPAVWEALLPHLPYRALLRNLGRMGSIGLLKPLSSTADTISERLLDMEALRQARVHPIAVLSALMTYQRGHGVRGSLTWTQAAEVVDALEAAFEGSFATIEPTGLRYYLGLDVSASMGMGAIAGVAGLTPRMGAAALAMVTARTETRHVIRGFTAGRGGFYSGSAMVDLPLTASSSFANAIRATSNLPFGGTDCALPMIDAMDMDLEVDVFVILIDNETWAGGVHPSVALQKYRDRTGIDAKLVVVGMTSTGYTIADPEDGGMLDVVGFDTAAPEIIRSFALGEV